MKKKVRIIPRIDIKNNFLVKGVQLEGLRVLGDPIDFVNKYVNDGADEIFYGYNMHEIICKFKPILNFKKNPEVCNNFILNNNC